MIILAIADHAYTILQNTVNPHFGCTTHRRKIEGQVSLIPFRQSDLYTICAFAKIGILSIVIPRRRNMQQISRRRAAISDHRETEAGPSKIPIGHLACPFPAAKSCSEKSNTTCP